MKSHKEIQEICEKARRDAQTALDEFRSGNAVIEPVCPEIEAMAFSDGFILDSGGVWVKTPMKIRAGIEE